MAETSTQDVVNQAQSVGDSSPIDVSGRIQTSTDAGAGDEGSGSGVEKQNASGATPSAVNNQDVRAAPGKLRHIERITDRHQDASNTETTSDYAHVNGIDSASHQGSEDAGYQRSTDGEAQGSESHGPEDSNWRQRSNSTAKRATSFKSVNVTKTYLAKTGTSATNAIKTGMDKGSAGAQSTIATAAAPKPRLVAKLGRDKLSHSISGAPAPGGPDASKVWNRNRRMSAVCHINHQMLT